LCGRFTQFSSGDAIARLLDLEGVPDLPPRYNVALTQAGAAVRLGEDARRALVWLRWGLIPTARRNGRWPGPRILVQPVASAGAAAHRPGSGG
jgi:putative SOS response-associated peptidase YedK